MSQRTWGSLFALMAIACSLILALPALADSNVRIVRLSYVDGDAQVNLGNQDQGFTHAVLNMPVTGGMWMYTPDGGRAEVQFENGSTVRMVNDAELQFEHLSLATSGGKINNIRIDHGIVYLNFDKFDKGDRITINVAGKDLRLTKASRLRIDASEKATNVTMFHGEATFDGDKPVELKSKETVSLSAQAADGFKTAKGADKLPSDSWNKDRDNETEVLASRNTPNANLNVYNSQFSYLGAYGNYFNVSGYGTVWQPFGMMPGWDPFSNGVWGLYPGAGYAWISPYPWGWAPYRYGQWNYASSYGWFWAPGSNFSSLNLGPRVGSVPAGWRAPVAPSVAGGVTPAKLVVVGNPPNVHPSIMTGHAVVGTRPDTRPVAANQHVHGSVMPTGSRPQPGTMPRSSMASGGSPSSSSGRVGPSSHAGGSSMHSAPAVMPAGNGRPK
jgi:hypothetical protein